MAVITKGYSFGATETVTNTKLHNLVDLASITGIVNADIDAAANISSTKLGNIKTIADTDGDTKIQVEESADEDTIRFDIAGSEKGTWNASGLQLGTDARITGFIDEDSFVSDSAVKVPTQQSVKAYITANKGQSYVNRGDPAAVDFTVSSFTTNAAYHDLDLSSIVPSGATLVHLTLGLNDGTVGAGIFFRKNGNSNDAGRSASVVQATNQIIYSDIFISLDANRIIEYIATNTTFTTIDLTVKGWWL